MNHIVCDHLRRWRWLWLGSCAICVLDLGAGHPLKPDFSNAAFMPLVTCLGAFLLSVDLSRGDLARLLRTLPVSARDLGRAWWWASVGLPGITVAGLTGLFYLFLALTHRPVSGVACFNYGLTTALLFGPQYFFFTGSLVPSDKMWANQLRGFCFSVLFVVTCLGCLHFVRFFPPPTAQWKAFLAVASVLTVASWFGAEQFAHKCLGCLPATTGQPYWSARLHWLMDNKLTASLRPRPDGRLLSASGVNGPGGGLPLLFQKYW